MIRRGGGEGIDIVISYLAGDFEGKERKGLTTEGEAKRFWYVLIMHVTERDGEMMNGKRREGGGFFPCAVKYAVVTNHEAEVEFTGRILAELWKIVNILVQLFLVYYNETVRL